MEEICCREEQISQIPGENIEKAPPAPAPPGQLGCPELATLGREEECPWISSDASAEDPLCCASLLH